MLQPNRFKIYLIAPIIGTATCASIALRAGIGAILKGAKAVAEVKLTTISKSPKTVTVF